ncbi:MAG: hypothetical protein NC180_13135 [Muribaculaceae bacterium]|nr:hypothetical protein [bacterium]MCM1494146.1 hypothetical protein [Muribaculaceae bacterium]
MDFLDKIRAPQKSDSIKRQALITIGILLFGIGMGWFSKYLDYRQAELPALLQVIDDTLDFHNFLGGFAPWIVIAVCISVYSHTPVRAAVNVFFFFSGFVASYYLYSNFVAGFFPKSYAFIWIAFTIASPFLAFLSWYAKGTGFIALVLSSGILGALLNTAFAYGMFYIDIRSWLNVLMLLFGILVLHKSVKETIAALGIAVVFDIVMEAVLPFGFW